jgi:UDP-glucose 4,6-dehydratase
MNVLVTGGLGFIGSNYVNEMYEKYPENVYYVIDCNNYAGSLENLKVPVEVHQVYIQDTEYVYTLLKDKNIDTIVHFAAQSFVDASFINSKLFIDDNILGTHSLLEATRRYNKIKLFLNMSTDEVYGPVHTFCKEDAALVPTNPYAASKVSAEMLGISYFYTHKIPVITVRSNNVYGENQYIEKLIPRFISLLYNNEKCTIHGKGDQLRSFIHTSDLNNALDSIMKHGNIGETYNVGTDDEYTVLEIAKLLIQFIHKTDKFEDHIEFVKDRVYNDSRYLVDVSKLRLLGWEKLVDFEKTLEKLVTPENKFIH